MDSPHEILGVDDDASAEELKRAYKRRVKDAHPDHGGSMAEFQLVKAAYEDAKAGTRKRTRSIADTSANAAREKKNRVTHEIEYLDYETIVERGWSLDDANLFERAAAADLTKEAYGTLTAESDESVLEAAERHGYTWPYACRGGACANCAVLLRAGDMVQPIDHVLPEEMTDRGFRLSCLGQPISQDLQLVFNVKHLPELDDLRLPPGPFGKVLND
ncbi:ferredoxin Fer [Halalkalirubrum salinum]|uniref:ferredoxin Fer n=1 Tax=Halalkalirubrum salinum TaxID=2563889 RepID=UPI0010FBB8EA|nr:ferredoxin Fer [Halalkalirubrum salinum]